MAYDFLKKLFAGKVKAVHRQSQSPSTSKFSLEDLEELITRSATSFEVEEILASLAGAELAKLAKILKIRWLSADY